MVNFTLATSETWNDRASGERKEKTEWHNVVIKNDKLGEIAEKYLKKGSKVYLEGRMETRKWQDQSGVDKYTTEVVIPAFRGELTMLSGRGEEGGMGGGNGDRGSYQPRERSPAGLGLRPSLVGGQPVLGCWEGRPDEIPF